MIYQLTQPVEHYFHPVITSRGLMPAQMASAPLRVPRPEINLNNLISTFPSASPHTLRRGQNRSETGRTGKARASVRGAGIVCPHVRRKGHHQAAWG